MASRQTAESWQKLRALWEADPVMSFGDVAKIAGVTRQAVQKKADKEGWKKISDQGDLARRAYDRADNALLTHPQPQADPASPPSLASTLAETAVDLRARVIERHRKEWDGARNNVYKAIQLSDYEKARLGKVTAEALKIIQEGERKAWGFDKETEEKSKVVIEIKREEA